MSGRTTSYLTVLALAVLFALPTSAHARRGFVLITHGEEMSEIADVPSDSLVRLEYPDAKLGYRYNQFGVFWLSIWTWGGEFCVYSEQKGAYKPGTPEELALLTGVPAETITKPFWYRLPPGLLIIVAVVALYVGRKLVAKRETPTEEPLAGVET